MRSLDTLNAKKIIHNCKYRKKNIKEIFFNIWIEVSAIEQASRDSCNYSSDDMSNLLQRII